MGNWEVNVLGEFGQLCWLCEKATNSGCSWSRNLIPIKGWIAKPDCLKPSQRHHVCDTYKIYDCPEFVRG